MAIKHTKVATTADDGTSEVGTNEWNDNHTIDDNTVTDAMVVAHTTTKITVPSTLVTGLTATDVSDFDTEVANNSAVTANTAKTGITSGQATAITDNATAITLRAPLASPTFTGTVVLPNVPAIVTTQLDLKAPLASPTFTGTVVLPDSQALVTPVLGTPTSGVLTNCTGLPLAGILASAKTEMIAIALGDESTVLATASTTVPVVTYHMPYAFTLTDVKVGLTVAGTGAGLVTIDVHEAGTTVLSTKVTVDATEKTSGTATTAMVISDSALAVDSLIEIFVDVIDTDNVASGAKVYLIGYQS